MPITEIVNQIIIIAFEMAKEKKNEYVTPEHLLYAILSHDENVKAIIDGLDGDVNKIKKNLLEYIEMHLETIENKEPKESIGLKQIFMIAMQMVMNSNRKVIDIEHIIAAIYDLEESYAAYYLSEQGIERRSLLFGLCHGDEYDFDFSEDDEEDEYDEDDDEYDEDDEALYFNNLKEDGFSSGSKKQSILSRFITNLNELVEQSNYDPLIGREDILERTIQILCRRTKNNPVHVGETGVGKTAITLGLAKLVNEDKVPQRLKGSTIISLDIGGLVAGTKFRGDFEERIKKVLEEVKKINNPIVYIDEIHNIVGAGATSGGSLDASNLLKPYLVESKIKFIGSTTYDEYKKHFEKDKALVRRFQKIEVKETSIEETVEILERLKSAFEEYHQVIYTKEALKSAVILSDKYINDRYLPDKAIDIIDEAGSYIAAKRFVIGDASNEAIDNTMNNEIGNDKIENNETYNITYENIDTTKITESLDNIVIDEKIIEDIISKTCNIPKQTVLQDEEVSLRRLENHLKENIFGQDQAIDEVTRCIKMSRAGLSDDNKPVASMLFVGPTGVGKTEIAKCLSKTMGIELVRFDMSEYVEKHAAAKLIGSPPGYVGYEEGGMLTDVIIKKPHCVLLLDEIEKAHTDILNVLLQVMDYASLTDNKGRKADFRNVIIIMTSNAGARKIGKSMIGFNDQEIRGEAIIEEVKKVFSPEFRNRLDKIVTFKHIDEDMAFRIAQKELNIFKDKLLKKQIVMEFTKESVEYIAKCGISKEFGAREIKRVIDSQIKPLLVEEILFGKLKNGGSCKICIIENKLSFDINNISNG